MVRAGWVKGASVYVIGLHEPSSSDRNSINIIIPVGAR